MAHSRQGTFCRGGAGNRQCGAGRAREHADPARGGARRGDRTGFDELDQRFHMGVVEASRMLSADPLDPGRVGAPALPAGTPAGSTTGSWSRRSPSIASSTTACGDGLQTRTGGSRAARKAVRCSLRPSSRFKQAPTGLCTVRSSIERKRTSLAGAVPFVAEGLDGNERVLAVTTPNNAEVLRASARPAGR